MSLYDPEHPQHLAHLARAKAASRRTTEMLDAADQSPKPALAQRHDAVLASAGRPEGERLPTNSCAGIAEAKAAAAIDRENRRVPWAQRVAGGRR